MQVMEPAESYGAWSDGADTADASARLAAAVVPDVGHRRGEGGGERASGRFALRMELAAPRSGRTAERLRPSAGRVTPRAQTRAVASRAKAAMMTATRT
jgi:hypothetical protein